MFRRFWSNAWLYYKGRLAAFNIEEFIGMQLFYPLINLCFYCFIAAFSFQTTDLSYWVIGNAFLLCTNSCIFGLGNIFVGERFNGRLRSIIASPCSKFSLILANGVGPTVVAFFASLVGLLVGAVAFRVDFSAISIPMVLLTIVVAMLSASCFGLFLAVFGLISDSMHLVLNTVSCLLTIFTGAEFPIEQLPLWGRIIAHMMPLTKAIKGMNYLFEKNMESYARCMLLEVLTGVFYVLLARAIFGYIEKRACQDGRFEMF